MRLIIAGGRDYRLTAADRDFLDSLDDVEMVIVGGARGTDDDGHMWAVDQNVPVLVLKADWERHGKAAGPIRNRQMADCADAVVLFPGGKGTESMAAEAEKACLTIFDRRYPMFDKRIQ
jgi:hypothetical protein